MALLLAARRAQNARWIFIAAKSAAAWLIFPVIECPKSGRSILPFSRCCKTREKASGNDAVRPARARTSTLDPFAGKKRPSSGGAGPSPALAQAPGLRNLVGNFRRLPGHHPPGSVLVFPHVGE